MAAKQSTPDSGSTGRDTARNNLAGKTVADDNAASEALTDAFSSIEPPLGLYIHIPWCVKKCPYCDFNSHVSQQGLPEAAYVQALIDDIRWQQPNIGSRPIQSIFFGGGTPSLFSAQAIGDILAAVENQLGIAAGAEITLEANPGTAEAARFAGYRAAGVNRLSMGVQSLRDEQLKALGRIHSAAEAEAAYGMARAAGFDNINLDLMYGLPQQTLAQAEAETVELCSWQPEHISHYQLTLEPETPFFHRPPPLPEDEIVWDMQEACQAILAAHGYAQYEVSAYAQPACECRHNLNYWRFGDYLGAGAGAHGKLSAGRVIGRQSRHKAPGRFMATSGGPQSLDEQRELNASDRLFEFAVNALRLRNGFTRDEFVTTTGMAAEALDKPLAEARRLGWLSEGSGRIAATELGYRYLNDVILLFDES